MEKDSVIIQEQNTRRLFFIALTISLLGKLYFNSTWPGHYFIGGKIALLGLLVIMPRFVVVLSSMPIRQRQFVLLLCPLIIITCLSVYERTYVVFPFLFCVSAWNIPMKEIVKLFFTINLLFMIVTVMASLFGVIENKVAERETMDMVEAVSTGDLKTRYCFGYNWVTAFAAHVTYLHLMWWYLRNGILKKKDYVLLLFSIWFVNEYCDARTEMISMSLIILLSLYYRFYVIKVIRLSWLEHQLLIYSVPLCASLMIFLTYQYAKSSNELYAILDLLMSGRLHLGADAMFTEGIKFFGQIYEQHGAGSDEGPGAKYFYNFIDCSYLAWLIIYGVFFFALSIITFTYICKKSVSTRGYLMAMILSILAIESAIVSVFLSFPFNPFYMGLLAAYTEVRRIV